MTEIKAAQQAVPFQGASHSTFHVSYPSSVPVAAEGAGAGGAAAAAAVCRLSFAV